MKSGGVGMVEMLRRAFIIAVCVTLVGCAHHRVRRLLRSERFEEGVAAAEAARRPVRGATARAVAEAKVALSRLGDARDLLQADFRRGGEVKSLFALATLESSMGLDGIAAARWGMLARLAPELVHSDPNACRLLLSRGASRQSWGEFAAADADLELVEALCSEGELRVLGEEATARRNQGYGQAVQDVVARNAPVRCDPGPCQRWGGDVHEARDADGPAAGSEVSTYVAQATREFAGRGGVVPITDREVQAQLGHASRADLEAALRDVPEDVAAYVRLRVSGVWTDTALSPVEAKKLRLRVEESSGASAHGWMLRWLERDFTFAQFDVGARLRRMLADPGAAQSAEAPSRNEEVSVDDPRRGHWAEAVPVRDDSIRLLLVLARLLARKGDSESALRLRATVFAAVGSPAAAGAALDSGALVEREVVEILAEGRPWSALYLASQIDAPQTRRRVLRACWAWIGLRDALCGGACGEMEDRAVVTAFLGRDAVATLDSMVLNVPSRRDAVGEMDRTDCGLAWRTVGSDSEWGRLVRQVGGGDSREDAAAIVALSERDPALGCRARLLSERLGAMGAVAALKTLAGRREGATDDGSSMAAESEAATLLAMGAPRRALQRLEQAAALSRDPRAVWVRGYVSSVAIGAREVSLRALREVVLHSAPSEARVARRLLELGPWRDLLMGRGGPSTQTDASVRRRAFQRLLELSGEATRWATVEWMMRSLLRIPGATLPGSLRVMGELQSLAPLERHSAAMDRAFAVGAGAPQARATASDAMSACAESAAATAPGGDAARCLRRILGATPLEAAQVMESLLSELPAARRQAVILWMLDSPGGWGPSAAELFPNSELNLRLALGLSIAGWVDLEGPRLDTTLLR